MRHITVIIISIVFLMSCQSDSSNNQLGAQSKNEKKIESIGLIVNEKREGDIIFQTSLSSQSLAIQKATHSKYSHMGMLFRYEGEWFVYEAIQPVSITPLKKWINRGENDHFVVKRLSQFPGGLSDNQVEKLKEVSVQYQGKDYDLHFGWGNDQIYCSELVWKIYEEGLGISLCELKELSEFDLSDEVVKNKLTERYGTNIPLQEKVVSPEDIFQSELLEEIEIGQI